jgi:hypothetical protein
MKEKMFDISTQIDFTSAIYTQKDNLYIYFTDTIII